MIPREAEKRAALAQIAELLKITDPNPQLAITTEARDAKVQHANGSLEVTLGSEGRIDVESPRSPGVSIELIDPARHTEAPLGAVYVITAHMPYMGVNHALNGDVYSVYVGKEGIMLDLSGRQRAAKLYEQDQKRIQGS